MTITALRPMEPGTGASPISLPVIPGNGEADRTVVLGSEQITAFMANAASRPAELPAEPAPHVPPPPVRLTSGRSDTVRVHLVSKVDGEKPHGGPAVLAAVGLAAAGVAFALLAHTTPGDTSTPTPPPVTVSQPAHTPTCDIYGCGLVVVPVAARQPMTLGQALGMAVVAP
jgi:hypothetical protein